jgi:adenylate cyclase
VSTDDPGRLKRLNRDLRFVKGARLVRQWLPGDERYGDPLSKGGRRPSELAGRQLSELTAESPGVMRELGLGALQVWQALSEAQGRGRGDVELAIVFTDLSGFSSWALEKGDTLAVNLLRDVGEVLEPPLTDRGGTIVKRLGDGLMAVFADPQSAVTGVLEASESVDAIDHDGYRPRLRAGIHLGCPRRLGGDYLGVDVNIAARVVEAAKPQQVLVSEVSCHALDPELFEIAKAKRLKAPGAPKELKVAEVERPQRPPESPE